MNYGKIKNAYLKYINDNKPLGYEIKAQRLKRDLTLRFIFAECSKKKIGN